MLDGLALLYQAKGDYVRAGSLHQQALGIFEKSLSDDQPKFARPNPRRTYHRGRVGKINPALALPYHIPRLLQCARFLGRTNAGSEVPASSKCSILNQTVRALLPMANEKRQKRVLYVEASDLVQASHGLVFERLNCSVFQVASANAAIDALETEEPFDLVLVGDLSKPVDDEDPQPELSVIQKARKLSPTVPILVFTSHNYLEDAYKAGATAHLLKPAGVFDLIDLVSPYLSLSSRSSKRPQERDSGEDSH